MSRTCHPLRDQGSGTLRFAEDSRRPQVWAAVTWVESGTCVWYFVNDRKGLQPLFSQGQTLTRRHTISGARGNFCIQSSDHIVQGGGTGRRVSGSRIPLEPDLLWLKRPKGLPKSTEVLSTSWPHSERVI